MGARQRRRLRGFSLGPENSILGSCEQLLSFQSRCTGPQGIRKGQDSCGYKLLFPTKVDPTDEWIEQTPWKTPTSIITFFFFFEVEFIDIKLKVNNLVAFSAFGMLHNHHLH